MVFNLPYLENELDDPPLFFAFVIKVGLSLTAWQVYYKKKKYYAKLILGANVLDPMCGNLTHGIT